MPFIKDPQIKKKSNVTGPVRVEVSPNYSHHVVAIEGDTGEVTVTFLPSSFQNFQVFSDDQGVMQPNTSATFVQGSVTALLITPVNSNPYSVVVSDY